MENWKEFWRKTIFSADITILRLKFVSNPVVNQVPTATIEIPVFFYFKAHTKCIWASLEDQKVTHHKAYPAVFGEKQEVSDQLPQ